MTGPFSTARDNATETAIGRSLAASIAEFYPCMVSGALLSCERAIRPWTGWRCSVPVAASARGPRAALSAAAAGPASYWDALLSTPGLRQNTRRSCRGRAFRRSRGDPGGGLIGPSIHLLPGCPAARMVDVGRAWPQKLPRPRPMTTRRGRGVRLAADRHSEPRLLPQSGRLPMGVPRPYARAGIYPDDRRRPLRRCVHGQLVFQRLPRHPRPHL